MSELTKGGGAPESTLGDRIGFGIGCAVVGLFGMSVMDACAKFLGAGYAVSQVILARNGIGALAVLVFAAFFHAVHLGHDIEDGEIYRAEIHVTDEVGNESVVTVMLDSADEGGCSASGKNTALPMGLALMAGMLLLRRRRLA